MTKIWTISEVWNKSIEQREEKPLTPRDRIWASELGKQDLDVYLKMLGEPVTNPFDTRAYRKFEAGNLFEWIIELVLRRCGVYQSSQEWIGNTEFGVQVSGKLDHLAGGVPQYDEAREMFGTMELPDLFSKGANNILDYFQEKYPDGLPQQIIEVKSTSSFGIEIVYSTEKAVAGHDLQAFHYAYNKKLPAVLLYISKDDLRMCEIPILPDNKVLLEIYKAKIERITEHYNKKQEPEKEPEVVWEEDRQRFSKNFNVEYSPYLTRNYRHKTPGDYDEVWGKKMMAWNRVVERIKSGKKITDSNQQYIEEMTHHGFDVISLVPTQNDKEL